MQTRITPNTDSFYAVEEAVLGILCKNILLADLLGSQYLFEVLKASLTVKISENVVKSECFEKHL